MDEYVQLIISTAKKPQAAYQQKRLIDLITSVVIESETSVEEVDELLRAGVDPSAADFLKSVDKWSRLSFPGRTRTNLPPSINWQGSQEFEASARRRRRRALLTVYLPEIYFASPLCHTAAGDCPKLTELLLTYKANPNSWSTAYAMTWIGEIHGLDLPVLMTPAHGAVYYGSERCLQTLIQFGADVNARVLAIEGVKAESHDVGYTPLHIAARDNNMECVKLLLDHGADPCATDAKGQTSLYLAAKHGNADVVMALLNSDAGDTSLSIPTPGNSKNTALHECLSKGEKMTECIKELVRRGADVGLRNAINQSPMDLALKYKWRRDIIELLVLKGRGMDFDRRSPSSCSPIETVMFRPRPMDPGTLVIRKNNNSVSHTEWDDSLAMLFLQMGASRGRLEKLLWYELNRGEPGNRLLDTLMDSFAYLPSLSQLKQSASAFDPMHVLEAVDSCYREDFRIPPRLVSFAEAVLGDERDQKMFMASIILTRRGLPTDDVSVRYLSRKHIAPASLVRKKKVDYCRRRREVPTLAHLCRSTVRHILKADVRQVISFPIPTLHKEHILLGYQLRSGDQNDGEQRSVPSNSSSESGHPELSTS